MSLVVAAVHVVSGGNERKPPGRKVSAAKALVRSALPRSSATNSHATQLATSRLGLYEATQFLRSSR